MYEALGFKCFHCLLLLVLLQRVLLWLLMYVRSYESICRGGRLKVRRRLARRGQARDDLRRPERDRAERQETETRDIVKETRPLVRSNSISRIHNSHVHASGR